MLVDAFARAVVFFAVALAPPEDLPVDDFAAAGFFAVVFFDEDAAPPAVFLPVDFEAAVDFFAVDFALLDDVRFVAAFAPPAAFLAPVLLDVVLFLAVVAFFELAAFVAGFGLDLEVDFDVVPDAELFAAAFFGEAFEADFFFAVAINFPPVFRKNLTN